MADTEILVKINAKADSAEAEIEKLKAKLNSLGTSAGSAAEKITSTINTKMQSMMSPVNTAMTKFGNAVQKPMQSVKGLIAACGPLGAAVAAGFAAEKVVEFTQAVISASDQYTMMQARIKMINDGTQTQAELMEKIHAAANSARASYSDMAAAVGKLGTLAKDAFSSNDEMIFFVQQMNKQFQLSGASIQESTAAMYQLTQAMASGRLMGDEFRSIMENAPMLAQAIAQEMGVSMGTLREMSSQGLITADVIKNAMINTADETNKKFNELPQTFSSLISQLGNNLITSFAPVLEKINGLINSEGMQSAIPVITGIFTVMAETVSAAIDVLIFSWEWFTTVITTSVDVLQGVGSIFLGVATAIPPLLPLLAGLATYALLVGTNFGISATRVVASMITQTAAIAKGIVQFTLYTTGVLLVAAAQGTLIVAQTLLSAQTYKTIAAITAETASWVVNAARKATVVTATTALRVAQMALNAVQIVATGLVEAYNAGLLLSTTRLAVMRGAQLAASAATAIFSGTMGILNAIMLANPIPIVIAALAAIAVAFGASEVSANGFGATLKSIWSSIVHTTVWAVNQIISMINTLIKGLNAVGNKLGSVFKFDYSNIKELDGISAEGTQEFIDNTVDFASKVGGMFDTTYQAEINTPAGGGGGGGYDTSGGGKGSGGAGAGAGAGSSADQAIEQAKQIHDAIENEWLDLFATKDKVIDKWYRDELEKLNESKDANVHYAEDLTRLNQLYAKKRADAIYEEQKAIREVQNKARDLSININDGSILRNLDGSAKLFSDIEQERKSAINKMLDDMQSAEDEFAAMNDRSKAAFIERLKAEGVAFSLTKDGMLSLAQARADQEVAINQEAQNKINEIRLQGKAIQADIDLAISQGRADSLMQYLEMAEYAQMQSYERQKEYMNEYVDAFNTAHMSMQEMAIQTASKGIDAVNDSIEGLLDGSMSFASAFQNIGKAISKTVSSMIADLIAARLKQSLFGKAMMAQEAAMSTAMATAQIGPWSQLALETSMATFGASAIAGRAAYTAAGGQAGGFGGVSGLGGSSLGLGSTGESFLLNNSVGAQLAKSSGLSMPFMASGGYAYGDTVAMIGEGKYPEAVLPLSDEVFDQMGEGINRAGGGGNITLNISTMDAQSFGSWLQSKGGQILRQYLMDTGREFASDSGVW
nr:MAG TPA: tail length tape measure protein [Caudoviricetes sp.]